GLRCRRTRIRTARGTGPILTRGRAGKNRPSSRWCRRRPSPPEVEAAGELLVQVRHGRGRQCRQGRGQRAHQFVGRGDPVLQGGEETPFSFPPGTYKKSAGL